MNDPHVATIATGLMQAIGRGTIDSVERLRGGGNNRVYRVTAADAHFLLKLYHYDPDDSRDRTAAEFEFSRFAWRGGIRSIPEPLAVDHTFHAALFAYVDGSAPRADAIDLADIDQALALFAALNGLRDAPASTALRFAAEACFSAADHLDVVAARVRRLERIAIDGEIDRAAGKFVTEELAPTWQHLAEHRRAALLELPAGERTLRPEQRCLSPSDFGFHNALLRRDGTFVFHDFEYAGWDDPAKTVCDFFCQPQVPIALDYWDHVVAGIDAAVGADSCLADRARLLLDVYRIKWCCIALNEFPVSYTHLTLPTNREV